MDRYGVCIYITITNFFNVHSFFLFSFVYPDVTCSKQLKWRFSPGWCSLSMLLIFQWSKGCSYIFIVSLYEFLRLFCVSFSLSSFFLWINLYVFPFISCFRLLLFSETFPTNQFKYVFINELFSSIMSVL